MRERDSVQTVRILPIDLPVREYVYACIGRHARRYSLLRMLACIDARIGRYMYVCVH